MRVSLSFMDTPDLAALVPDLMTRYPACEWVIVSGRIRTEDLMIELHPAGWPDRVATVHVNAGAEIFTFAFAGHQGHDFAYRDEDRTETLQQRIDLAVEAASGPTRVIRDQANGVTVRSTLVIDPDGPHPCPYVVSYPIRRIKSFLRGNRITREVVDFAATQGG